VGPTILSDKLKIITREILNTMKTKKIIFILSLAGLLGAIWPFSWLISHPNSEKIGTKAWIDKQTQIIESETDNLDPNVLRLSLKAYVKARQRGLDSKQLLTIIDYSKPSSERRLWVFDLKHGRELFNTWVSHGKNSGGSVASSFSNSPGSLKSSLGVFVTDEPYMGGHGLSLRIKGLEHGINDNAYSRDIVFHGARYVNSQTASQYGQVGRSWGCPAVSQDTIKSLIDTIKENTVIFAYYPDKHWLNSSEFLTG
jgi:hypothetical protein